MLYPRSVLVSWYTYTKKEYFKVISGFNVFKKNLRFLNQIRLVINTYCIIIFCVFKKKKKNCDIEGFEIWTIVGEHKVIHEVIGESELKFLLKVILNC